MSFFNAINTSASGLTAQRLRMDIISENLANANTTRTEDGTPFKRKVVLFQERQQATTFEQFFAQATGKAAIKSAGVRVSEIVRDEKAGPKIYDPSHPDADAEGYVEQSNVNVVEEMVNLISASRSYEANITAIGTSKSMLAKTLEMATR
ncbi:MAG: flagellar basal body rod protein FlgC [Clostridiales bacterium]|jgi:flagellar basal-body rod protein FlgC|nr:flagellar basal body rod protein FlgC [Clostridiales bacterium]